MYGAMRWRDAGENPAFSSLCLAVLDYSRRMGPLQRPLNREGRQEITGLLRIIEIVNDWYDLGKLDASGYRQLRRRMGEQADGKMAENWRKAFALMRKVEKTRPQPPFANSGIKPEMIIAYREQQNAIITALLYSSTHGIPFEELIDNGERISISSAAPDDLQTLYWLILAFQVVDDQVGWRGDAAAKRPSFYTAFCPNGDVFSTGAKEKMDELHDQYIKRARAANPDFSCPLILAMKAVKATFPPLINLARRTKSGPLVKFWKERGLSRDMSLE